MEFVLNEYLPLAIFLVISVVISCLFVLANFLIAVHNPDPEKNSAYECGFQQFGDSRMKFDVRFYLVTLLFSLRLQQGAIDDFFSLKLEQKLSRKKHVGRLTFQSLRLFPN